jgi:phenylacetic acid degradation protein
MVVPPRSLVAGIPARVLRELTEEELEVEGRGYGELPGPHSPQLRLDAPDGAPLDAPEPVRRPLELPELLPLSTRKGAEP